MTHEIRCEACGGALYAIIYGMPSYETFQAVADGAHMVLDGCVVPPNPPSHQCHDCGLEVSLGEDLVSRFSGSVERLPES